jgi:hypothetical protein
VYAIRDSPDYRSLTDWLEPTRSVESVGPTKGDYHTWPEQWAIDSVQQARKAYQKIAFNVAVIDGQRLRFAIQLPTGYIDEKRPLVATQLTKAGLHLAQLVNCMAWP